MVTPDQRSDQRIVTLTLNPALDVSLAADRVVPTHKIRTDRPRYQPGGGGINVSRVCHRLGNHTIAVVPLGGPSGQRMRDLMLAELDEAEVRIVPIAGDTRESLTVRSKGSGEQYRFVLPGPEIAASELEACLEAVVTAASPDRCRSVVVSGSLPPGVDPGFISDLVARMPHAAVVVDTSGAALVAALQSGAYLVKPSARELASIVQRELETEADIIDAANEVKAQSPVEVLVVSIGPGGAVVLDGDTTHRLRAPAVRVRSAVGAGDSMVAGIAAGLQRNLALLDAVRLGVAAGSAAVLTDGSDLCQQSDVDRLLTLVSDG